MHVRNMDILNFCHGQKKHNNMLISSSRGINCNFEGYITMVLSPSNVALCSTRMQIRRYVASDLHIIGIFQRTCVDYICTCFVKSNFVYTLQISECVTFNLQVFSTFVSMNW